MPKTPGKSGVPGHRSRLVQGQDASYLLSYEDRLAKNPGWALSEGSNHFEGKGAVEVALRKIAKRFDELGIPYAIVGAMAMFSHGYRRFTEDVDILVTAEGLKKAHEELAGLGYVPPFAGSKNLRDTDSGVRIEFLVAGNFPGDGKPKPVAFPEPAAESVRIDGINYLNLNKLVELKLASGMTNPGRLKDLADVQEIIKALKLPLEFSEQLDSYVRAKYVELWQMVRQSPEDLS